MCGICGVVQVGGVPREVVPRPVVDRMTDVLAHRGPNDRGIVVEPGVALGARRLSIVDVAGGHQPFASEDGSVWAAQNGELYNHVELRRGLEAERHRFVSRCDTEVLPHLYEREGERYPELLRGKFATVVWDGRRRRAVLARDRLGVKPLYWARRGDLVVFGSELKSVLASGLIEPELDYEAIDAYLTFGFLPGPRTPLREVWKLLPGHRLIVDPDGVRSEAYWRYPTPQPDHGPSEQEHAERLLELLEESVRLRLMSDVPLGAMLSGGLDSSLIVALMARNMPEPVKTFSVGFREAAEGNELADARQVAAHFGTDHHELELSLHDQQLDLPTLLWHLDEPLADLSALGFHHLSHLAAQHVTVALSGQGADELLGGYPRHRNAWVSELWSRLPRSARAAGLAAARRGPARAQRAARVLGAPTAAARYVAQQSQLDEQVRRDLVRGALAAVRRAPECLVEERAEAIPANGLGTVLYLDAQLGLVDDMLHYFDRTSMAHSLEVRVPFLDHHLVEHCATIPDELKVRRGETKYLLRRAAAGIVPGAVIERPKVGFFNAAVGAWFRSQLDGVVADYLLAPEPRYASFVDQAAVERHVRAYRSGDASRRHLLLSLLMLEAWLVDVLPRAIPARVERHEVVAG
jgi:asparagine synthase (glutamine-hydrolysing)